MSQKSCIIVGSGIGGLGAALLLADKGYAVTVIEKNQQVGGRAGQVKADGLTFDTGPSWYLMPEVFEKFFESLGESIHDHLELVQLTPSYRVYFEEESEPVDIFSDQAKDAATFEAIEPGSGKALARYLARSAEQYELVRDNFLATNLHRPQPYFSQAGLKAVTKIPLLGTMQRYVEKYFSDYRLQQLMQYTLVFLGSSPYNAPALYNIMSHLDFSQGVFYPQGGIYTLIEALEKLARKKGVQFRLSSPVDRILVEHGKVRGTQLASGEELHADVVIANADMQHVETQLLAPEHQTYPQGYWEKRVMGPSSYLMRLGIQGEIPSLLHHTLYFAKDWKKNFAQVFDDPSWPDDPSFYISNPSKTDASVTVPGVENVFVLVPLGAGVEDTPAIRAAYREKMLDLLETKVGIVDVRSRLVSESVFGPNDFKESFNSYKGSALGLAHTLGQSAFLRPATKSKKVRGLYYVGAGVHPGIGMPVCLISAQLAAEQIPNA